MSPGETLTRIARTDSTFALRNGLWVGKCLICNGPIAFDPCSGEGATLEHIRARSRGGDDSPENLAVVHSRCNSEKGIRWDNRKRCSDADYEPFISRLIERRKSRLHDPDRL
jgi:5-methylcytosine-specific restriction endonuclease McrA